MSVYPREVLPKAYGKKEAESAGVPTKEALETGNRPWEQA